MELYQREGVEQATLVGSLERILGNRPQIADASSAATSVENLPTPPYSLEAALDEVATAVPRAEAEETFDGLADTLVLKESPHAKLWYTQTHCQPSWKTQCAVISCVSRH